MIRSSRFRSRLRLETVLILERLWSRSLPSATVTKGKIADARHDAGAALREPCRDSRRRAHEGRD